MIEQLAAFLQTIGEINTNALSEDQKNDIITKGKNIWLQFSELMEIGVFAMTSSEPGWDVAAPIVPGQKPDHYDIVVSIKLGDGEIFEIDEIENVTEDGILNALTQMASKYPHATLLNEDLLDKIK